MKNLLQKRLRYVRCLTVALWLSCIFSCGVPIVPSASQLSNYALNKQMQLITEVVLSGIDFYLPTNTLGPEQDLVPFLVPQPSNPTSHAWIVFPSLMDTNGQALLGQSKGGSLYFQNYGNAIYPVDMAAGNSVHTIPFDSQYQQAGYASLSVASIGSHFARLQTFPLSESGTSNGTRLAILTPSAGSNNQGQSRLYLLPFEGLALSDKGGISNLGGTNGNGGLTPINYYNFPGVTGTDAPITYGSDDTSATATTIAIGSTYLQVVFPAMAPDRTGALLVDTAVTGTIPPATQIPVEASEFVPGPAVTPGIAALGTTPEFTFGFSSDLLNAIPFFTWSQKLRNLNSSFWGPSGSNPSYTNYYLSFGSISPKPSTSSVPIVRVLQDGTTLGLQNNQWVKLNSDGSPSGSSPINTGSMIFCYEYLDSGVDWLVFSEAELIPGPNGKDLRLRAWKVKKTDLIP